jgi:hypothetical protein
MQPSIRCTLPIPPLPHELIKKKKEKNAAVEMKKKMG